MEGGWLEALAAPFGYDFMWRALFGATMVGAMCGLLSCFVTLRGWSLLGDALSHAVLPGVAVAAIAGLPFIVGAFVAGLLAVAGIGAIERNSKLKSDAVIGVVLASFFAFGLLLISIFPSQLRLKTILFGNLLGLSDDDLWQVAAAGLLTAATIAWAWRDLLAISFDAQHATAIGLRTRFLNLALLSLVSLSAVAALQAVGALLVVATLITPGATAYLLTDRFPRMLLIAPALGGVSAFGGAYASYFLDGSAGGCIVAAQTALFLAVWILAPKHGVLASRVRTGLAPAALPRPT